MAISRKSRNVGADARACVDGGKSPPPTCPPKHRVRRRKRRARRRNRARRGAIPTCRASGRSPRSRRSNGRLRSPDKAQLTEQEAAEAEKTFLTTQNQDRRDGAGTDADVALAYNDFWWDRGTKVVSTRQTSLVVDPPDGRVPALTAEGRARATARAARGYDSWQDRSLWERCITRGLPMIPGPVQQQLSDSSDAR